VEPTIEVLRLGSIHELPSILPRQTRYFTLLLACDASGLSDRDIICSVEPLVKRGLVYFSAWGQDCERVHDLVDQIVVRGDLEGVEEDYLLMTTWHRDKPLEDATWYFEECALPSEPHVFGNFSRIAVAVGNKDWADIIEQCLRRIEDGTWEYND
jgi:hypothetical protein